MGKAEEIVVDVKAKLDVDRKTAETCLRLIDANDFVKHFWQRVHDGEIVTLMDAEHAIINAPTVDAVEVVRCKDCKHRKAITIIGENRVQLHCRMWYGLPGVDPDEYCSRGERKDRDHNESN